MRTAKRLWISLAVSLVMGAYPCLSRAAGQTDRPEADLAHTPRVVAAEGHARSPRLRDTPPMPPETPAIKEIPRHPRPRRPGAKGVVDPALQTISAGLAMPAPAGSFEGVGNVNGVLPPDPVGAVGPHHYVQWVNLSFAIFDKATGALVYGPAAGNTLWQALGGPCAAQNNGDAVALYDHLAGRWFFTQLALPNYPSGPFYQCIAVSQTSDPTGAFNLYMFKISDTKLNDYPKFGVWPDAYYMTTNQFLCAPGCSWAGQGVAAFDRAKMLNGLPATMVYFDLDSRDPTLGGMLPSDLNGPEPPAGTPNPFVQFDDDAWGYSPDQLQIWAFHVDWITPSNSSFTKQATLLTAPFDSNLCGYSSCVPQAGTASKVDALSDRLMYRLQYRNFGTYATLVTNHTVDVDGTDHAGIRWYELRNNGGGWSIYQQGSFAPDADHRFMGSAAMDGVGNIALGYSMSGISTSPSIRYSGRLATDPLGTLPQGEAPLVNGTGSQTSSSGRWGDYSLMAVDPTDDCTFWYTQEYYAVTSSAGWHTRFGSFRFASCGAAPSSADLSLTKAGTPNPVIKGRDLTYTLTVLNHGPATATTITASDFLPGGVTLKSATPSQGTCSTGSTVTCALGSLGPGAGATVAITVTPAIVGSIGNTATVSASEPDPTPANNSATVSTTVVASPAPVVSACIPSGATRGSQLTVAVTGANFQNGATAKFGRGISILSVTFASPSEADVKIKIGKFTSRGSRTVTITNPDKQSGIRAGCFTVN